MDSCYIVSLLQAAPEPSVFLSFPFHSDPVGAEELWRKEDPLVCVCVCRTQGFLLTGSAARAEEVTAGSTFIPVQLFKALGERPAPTTSACCCLGPCGAGLQSVCTLFCLFLPNQLPKGQKPENVLIWDV